MSSMRLALFALAAAVLLAPSPASAKEESKLQITLDPVSGGLPQGGGRSPKLRTQFMPGVASLQLQASGLAPSTEHALLSDGIEIVRFTTGTNGQANVKVDLLQLVTADFAAAPVDPRGTRITIHDGTTDVYAGWLFGPVENDPSRVMLKESTSLAPDALAAPSGTANADYMMTPNRKGKLRISLIGAPPGDYEVWVDDVLVGTMTTNPAGNANADFRSDAVPGAGNGNGKPKKGGNAKLPMDFDPRMAWIELRMAGAPVFAGEMAAQIGGLNVCLPSEGPVAMVATAAQPGATGTVTLGIEDDCSREVSVAVAGVLPGAYDLAVDGVVVGSLLVAADGTGSVAFDTSPDEIGELSLDFSLPSGSVLSVDAAGVQVLFAQIP